MKTTARGPGWSGDPGEIVDRPEAEALELVTRRFADLVDPDPTAPVPAPAQPTPPVIEDAEAPAAAETAEAPENRRRRR